MIQENNRLRVLKKKVISSLVIFVMIITVLVPNFSNGGFLISKSTAAPLNDDSCGPKAFGPYIFCFEITTNANGENFSIPTSGGTYVDDEKWTSKKYNWDIDWGDSSPIYNKSGNSDHLKLGITHSYQNPGTHLITITPNANQTGIPNGWLSAFGLSRSYDETLVANADIISRVISPIYPQMTRTDYQIHNPTSRPPDNEWSFTFKNTGSLIMGNKFTFDQKAWEKVTDVGNNFGRDMFGYSRAQVFTMGDNFNLPQNILKVGDYFVSHIFGDAKSKIFNLNKTFNLPPRIRFVGDSFASEMFFSNESKLLTMNSVFNLPQSIAEVKDSFADGIFAYVESPKFKMNEVFNFPPNITSVGSLFGGGLFANISSDYFTMNKVFNFPQKITVDPGHFAASLFYNVTGASFAMNEVFQLPQNITKVGDAFAHGLFKGVRGKNFIMPERFNLPQKITKVGNDFASEMFREVTSPNFKMNSKFNLPSKITSVGDRFAQNMLSGIESPNFTMNSVFNLPQGITSVGVDFATAMFMGTSSKNFNMNSIFNLPQKLKTTDALFASYMFNSVSSPKFTMNKVFTFPPNIKKVGTNFGMNMFWGVSGASFNMNSVFNLPQNLTEVKDNFAEGMFSAITSPNFTMSEVFNLPTELKKVGRDFGAGMFSLISNNSFNMNDYFNLPPNIMNADSRFASSMFSGVKSKKFTMNSIFNLPQKMGFVGESAAASIFYNIESPVFQVNNAFKLPKLEKENLVIKHPLSNALFLSKKVPLQKRSALAIMNGNTYEGTSGDFGPSKVFGPAGTKVWQDLCAIPKSYGGTNDCKKLEYDPNGANVKIAAGFAQSKSFTAGDNLTVNKNSDKLSRFGYKFKEWNTKSDGKGKAYQSGSKLNNQESSLVLYAIWDRIPGVSATYYSSNKIIVSWRGKKTDKIVIENKLGNAGNYKSIQKSIVSRSGDDFVVFFSNLPTGTYRVKATSDGKTTTSKWIRSDLSKGKVTYKFTDIKKVNAKRQADIKWLAKMRITTGVGCNSKGGGKKCKYLPNNVVNRGAMAQFLHKVAALPKSTRSVPKISDISKLETGRANDIKWLAAEKVTVPSKGKYNPQNAVNRGAMADFMWKLAGSPKLNQNELAVQAGKISGDKNMSKLKKSNKGRYDHILWLAQMNITVIGNDGKYNPQKPVNRGAMAQFMHKLYYVMITGKAVPADGVVPDPVK